MKIYLQKSFIQMRTIGGILYTYIYIYIGTWNSLKMLYTWQIVTDGVFKLFIVDEKLIKNNFCS